MTNYSRSVLKSNGLRHSKIRLKKFGFSLKTFLANIVKKLPPQCCSKPFLIAFFNFSHKWPTFAFTGESGYTLGFAQRIAHKGLHGETRTFRTGGGITTLDTYCTFTNIPGPGIRTAYFAALGRGQGCSQRTQRAFGTAMHLCVSLFRGVAAPLGCVICLQFGDVAFYSVRSTF